jgi:peptide/nickel transport system substrate-binding protein
MKNALALLLALTLASCSGPPASSTESGGRHAYTIPHTLRFGWEEDVAGLNPHLVNNVIVSYLSDLTMAWLLRGGPDSRPIPELAEAVPSRANGGISADGKTITFHLRKDAKWSDGAPFTSQDVIFSTKTVLDPNNNEQSRYGFDVIDGYKALGPYAVQIHLKRPYAAFLFQYFNSDGVMCILPSHILGSLKNINSAPYNALPVGIGPFRYVRWERGQQVEMEANPLYFRGRPKLDKVIYKIIPDRSVVATEVQTHEIDLYPLMAPKNYLRVKSSPGVATLEQPTFQASIIDFNNAHGAFSDIAVRRAFRAALDRPSYAAKIYAGLASLGEGFYPSSHPMAATIPLEPHDLAKTNSLLDRDGWTRRADGVRVKNGVPLEVEVVSVVGSAETDQLLELIRADVKPAGFALTVKHYPASMIFGPGGKLPKGDFDMVLERQTQDTLGDISEDFACDQKPPTGYNFGRVCDPQVDKLFAEFNATYDEAVRKKIAQAYQEKLVDDAAFVSLPSEFQLFAFNSDLKNYKPPLVSPFDNMMDVDI